MVLTPTKNIVECINALYTYTLTPYVAMANLRFAIATI